MYFQVLMKEILEYNNVLQGRIQKYPTLTKTRYDIFISTVKGKQECGLLMIENTHKAMSLCH